MSQLWNIVLISAIAVVLSFDSCKSKKTVLSAQQGNYISDGLVKATVIHYNLDGCTWLIQLEGGEKFEPLNLAQEFRKDKLPVWLKYQMNKGGVSICMAGKMIVITEIIKR